MTVDSLCILTRVGRFFPVGHVPGPLHDRISRSRIHAAASSWASHMNIPRTGLAHGG